MICDQVLLRRQQLGMKETKKHANKSAKAVGKAGGVRRKRSRKLDRLVKLEKHVIRVSGDKPVNDEGEAWEDEAWEGEDTWASASGDACGHEAWEGEKGWDEGMGDERGESDRTSDWTSVWELDESGNAVEIKSRQSKKEATLTAKEKSGAKAQEAPAKKDGARKPKPKGKAKAAPTSSANPKAKAKAKGKTSKKAEEEVSREKGKKVDKVLGWVDYTDVDVDRETYKQSLLPYLPELSDSIRLNKYWNRGACGVTLRYVDSDNERKQKDVAYFFFENSNVGMGMALACGIFTVPWPLQPVYEFQTVYSVNSILYNRMIMHYIYKTSGIKPMKPLSFLTCDCTRRMTLPTRRLLTQRTARSWISRHCGRRLARLLWSTTTGP